MSLLRWAAWWMPRGIERWTPRSSIEGEAYFARRDAQAVGGEAAEAGHTIDTAAAGTATAGLLRPSLANAATRVVAPPAKAGLVRLGGGGRGRGGGGGARPG